MPAGAAAQMRVTFEDITISFSQEEWGYLDEGQKELYREVMKENYETLISLETGYKRINADILSRIKQEDELYMWDPQKTDEREVIHSVTADEAIQKQKRKENREGHPVEMEQIPRQSGNVCENISKGTNRRNAGILQQEVEKEQSDPAGASLDGVTEFERSNRELLPMGEKPFSCIKCNKHYASLSELKFHQSIHTEEKTFVCSKCEKNFISSSYLRKHKIICMEEKISTFSDFVKNFYQQPGLEYHQRIHVGARPFTCPDCGKSFQCQSHLERHWVIHTGEKPYNCLECGKSFNSQSSLERHWMVHTGEKPFACSDCDKSFKDKSSLKAHQKIHTRQKLSN